MNDYTPADRARLTYEASGTVPRRVLECGCAETVGGLHRRDCPVWVNVGPDLRNRCYVRRDSRPERNGMTGYLTGHGVEQVTAALIRDDSTAGQMIRKMVKIYAAWQDDPTLNTTEGTDAARELICDALLVYGTASTNQDADRVLHKLVQAYRNGVRF